MKKVFLALALLAAAGIASAQSNVQIYGLIDAGLSKQTGERTKVESGIQNDSRIGFKGTEDLGNGTSAIFVLENGFDTSTGEANGGLFGRQAYVGLSSTKYGTVKLGRQTTPLYTTFQQLDPFAFGLAGDINRSVNYTKRMSNSVSYTAPAVVKGLTATVAYGFADDKLKTDRQVGASAAYTDGPLMVQAAFNDVENGLSTNVIGGSYKLAAFTAHALVTESELRNVETRSYLLGASKQVGTGTVIADVIRQVNHDLDGRNNTQVALGYTHPLSKRTNLYTSAARTFKRGTDVNMVNAGVRHTF